MPSQGQLCIGLGCQAVSSRRAGASLARARAQERRVVASTFDVCGHDFLGPARCSRPGAHLVAMNSSPAGLASAGYRRTPRYQVDDRSSEATEKGLQSSSFALTLMYAPRGLPPQRSDSASREVGGVVLVMLVEGLCSLRQGSSLDVFGLVCPPRSFRAHCIFYRTRSWLPIWCKQLQTDRDAEGV